MYHAALLCQAVRQIIRRGKDILRRFFVKCFFNFFAYTERV